VVKTNIIGSHCPFVTRCTVDGALRGHFVTNRSAEIVRLARGRKSALITPPCPHNPANSFTTFAYLFLLQTFIMAPLRQEIEYYSYKYPPISILVTGVVHSFFIITFPITCCCYCCYLHPFKFSCGGTRGRKDSKENRTANVHFEHQGRKVKRRSSLSIGQPTTPWRKLRQKKASSQRDSQIFSTLPPEIRELIYEYTFMDTGAVLVGTCREDKFRRINARPYTQIQTVFLDNESDITCQPPRSRSGSALLRTCRLIYTEALPILYARTQFVFEEHRSSLRYQFNLFNQVMPTSHLQHIRFLGLSYDLYMPSQYNNITETFDQYFQLVQSLKNLRTLYMAVYFVYTKEIDLGEATKLDEALANFETNDFEIVQHAVTQNPPPPSRYYPGSGDWGLKIHSRYVIKFSRKGGHTK
jgi:hypothetical protein